MAVSTFLCTKDNTGLLDVLAQAVACIAIPALFRTHEIAACTPGEVSATDGTVGDVRDIFDRSEDHSFGADVGTAPIGQNAGDAAVIGLNLLFDLAGVLDDHMLLSDIAGLLGRPSSIPSTVLRLLAMVTGSLSTQFMIRPRSLSLRFLF